MAVRIFDLALLALFCTSTGFACSESTFVGNRKPVASIKGLKAVYEGKQPVTTPFERNYVVKSDTSQFVDVKRLDLRLKEDTTVYSRIKGFKPIPFEEIGLRADSYRRSPGASAGRAGRTP